MDNPNYVKPPNRDEYNINHHRKKIAALILAVIIYLLFLGPLIVDLVPQSWRSQTSQGPLDPLDAPQQAINKPRLAPAPVKYMSAPRGAQQPELTPPDPVQPQVQPIQPIIPQEIIQEPLQEIQQEPPKEHVAPEQPPKPEPIRDTPSTLGPTPKNDAAPEDLASEQPIPEQHTSQKIPRKRERSSRNKWLKESAQKLKNESPKKNVQQPRNAQQQQSLVSQVSQGLYEQMYYEHAQRESQSFEAAVANSNDNSAKSFELNIFLSKFVKAFCDFSTMNPLFIRTDSIPPHTIQFEATFSKKRKITKITFIKESADHRIGQYIKTILSDIVTPQLPSIWKEDEISMRFSIDLTRPHPGDRIWFVPGQF